jgi:penicillin amidase
VWSEPGASGYLGSSRLWRARTWDAFRAASGAWGAPPLNLVYAGRAGDIGWAASGRTPVRESWDGLVPVPGDGRYEWSGFLGEGLLPSIHDPADGFFASANEYNLPEGYPIEERRIAFEWTDPSRATRIKQVLAADSSVSLSDSMALQSDSVSPQARRVVALLKTLDVPSDPRVAEALERLRAWDGDETVHSVAAAIYEVMASKHLGKSLVAATVPAAAQALVGDGHLDAVISALEAPGPDLGADPEQTRRGVLLRALSGAVDELQERLGPDLSAWSWGRLHQASWTPAVAELADPQLKAQMSIGPLQTPGSGSTPRAQTYRAQDFSVVSGASVRIVVDVGRWDDSVVMNSPGQSGDPFVAHYRDLFPIWAEGAYVPLAFSRAAVDRVAESVLRLSPAD